MSGRFPNLNRCTCLRSLPSYKNGAQIHERNGCGVHMQCLILQPQPLQYLPAGTCRMMRLQCLHSSVPGVSTLPQAQHTDGKSANETAFAVLLIPVFIGFRIHAVRVRIAQAEDRPHWSSRRRSFRPAPRLCSGCRNCLLCPSDRPWRHSFRSHCRSADKR